MLDAPRSPSTHARRGAGGPRRPVAAQVADTLLAPVPRRQVVLTIPKRLRASCLYRRRLLGEIARVAQAVIYRSDK